MLKIQHLTKTYGDKKAVDDLSLHIQAGKLYGFIGHNGAGKTTTLKAAAGILQFDAGGSISTASPFGRSRWPVSGSWPTSPITPTCTIL